MKNKKAQIGIGTVMKAVIAVLILFIVSWMAYTYLLEGGKEGVELALDQSGDPDKDKVITAIDNCPTVNNPDQLDSDGDNIGDACEEGSAGTALA
jgi:hypothetical protein